MIRILSCQSYSDIEAAFKKMEVDATGIKIMLPKTEYLLVHVDSLSVPAANIIKQELLSLGGDAALNKHACDFSIKNTPCILIGHHEHFKRLVKKLLAQPFGLKAFSKELSVTLANFHAIPESLRLGKTQFDFSKRPFIMGIVNVTPDSFSGDGLDRNIKQILQKAEKLLEEGADILDIGGESTQPGAIPVSLEEERSRLIPAIKAIAKRFDVPISIDTSKAQIAKECIALGANLVNDVTGLTGDPQMEKVIQETKVPAVIMHPGQNGGSIPSILDFFKTRITHLEKIGIPPKNIILDPGIGFGKTPMQNLYILKRLEEFRIFGKPLLLGTSRKSFLGKILDGVEPSKRGVGTMATLVHGHLKGFHFFRVHDVQEARDVLAVSQAIGESYE